MGAGSGGGRASQEQLHPQQLLSLVHSHLGQTQRLLSAHSCQAGAPLSQESIPGMPATPHRALHYSDRDPAHSSLGD